MEQTKRGKVVVTGSFITDIAVRTPRFPADGETVAGASLQFGREEKARIRRQQPDVPAQK